MTNEEILANAPEDCFAVDRFIGSKHPVYICSTKDGIVAFHKGVKIGVSPKDYPFSVRFRSLSDIQRIVELEKRAEQLEHERDELKRELPESLRLFTNALLRKFSDRTNIPKHQICVFSAKRVENLRQQLNGEQS